MNKNIIIIGASSEFGISIAENFQKRNINVYGIGRSPKNKAYSEYLEVKNYVLDIKKIIEFIGKLDKPIVIFLNGYLRENRPIYDPSKEEIEKTVEANLVVPVFITRYLINEKISIYKFVFISSMSAIKPRFKNYIYGLSKQWLEREIARLTKDYLIFRFGMIKTSMSKNHSPAPFTLSKEKASALLVKKINRRGIIYPLLGLKLISYIIKVLPIKFLDRYEKFKG